MGISRHTPRLLAASAVRVLIGCCLLWLTACAQEGLVLRHWTLAVGPQAPGTHALHVAVTLPAHLDEHGVPARDGVYRLHAQIVLPVALHGRDLDFLIPRLWAVATLYADGERAVDLHPQRFVSYRRGAPHTFRIDKQHTRDGKVNLSLQVKHRWTQSAWFDVAPRIVSAQRVEPASLRSEILNQWAAMAALVTLLHFGFSAFVIFLIDRSRSLYLLFGIQAIGVAVYPAFCLGITQAVVGPYETTLLAEGLAIAGLAALHFSRGFYNLPPLSNLWNAAYAGLMCAFLLVNDPYRATAFSGPLLIVMLVVTIAEQLITGARQLARPELRRDALVYLSAWIAIALTTWTDFFVWLGLGDVLQGSGLGSLGLMLTALAFAFLLSQRHMASLRQADALNSELGVRVLELERSGQEIGTLNQELRRQVVERSAQIYAALSMREQQGKAPHFRVGEIVRERFRVISQLGTGGMGDVYEVLRLHDQQSFALKVTHERHTEALALLAREAQIAARIDHPNVVRTVDVDVSPDGLLFLVMELVRGKGLNQHVAQFGDLAWALAVLRQLASGLSALHEGGIVHRDLKPANVMIMDGADGKPSVKIADFGIASLTGHSEQTDLDTVKIGVLMGPPDNTTQPLRTRGPLPTSIEVTIDADTIAPFAGGLSGGPLTRSGAFVGTPAYMAPELARGAGYATPAADMFSFGLLAWELLTRGRPFFRPPALAILQGEQRETLRSIRQQWVEPDLLLADLIDGCLAPEPKLRPTAAALLQALENACVELGQASATSKYR